MRYKKMNGIFSWLSNEHHFKKEKKKFVLYFLIISSLFSRASLPPKLTV